MTAALEGGEWSAARSSQTLPPGKTRYPFYRRLDGPRTGLDGRKISSPPGFDSGPSSPYSVAIPTELPGPHVIKYWKKLHNGKFGSFLSASIIVKFVKSRNII